VQVAVHGITGIDPRRRWKVLQPEAQPVVITAPPRD
jgi:hypothetical protein